MDIRKGISLDDEREVSVEAVRMFVKNFVPILENNI